MGKAFYLGFLVILLVLASIVTVNVLRSSAGEHYSEVYFENLNGTLVVKPNTTVSITFYIRSHESTVTYYSFVVYLGNTSVAHGNLSLKPHEVAAVPVSITVKKVPYSELLLNKTTRIIRVSNSTGLAKILGVHKEDYLALSNPTYEVPGNNSFVFKNSSFSIVDTQEFLGSTGLVIVQKNYTLLFNGDGKYELKITTVKKLLSPSLIPLRVVVQSSTGETYKLFAIVEVSLK